MTAPQELVAISFQQEGWTQKEQWILGLATFGQLGIETEAVGSIDPTVFKARIEPALRPDIEYAKVVQGRTGFIRLYGEDVNQGYLDRFGYSLEKYCGMPLEVEEGTRVLRQKEKGIAVAGWAVRKIPSAAKQLGSTPEAAHKDGLIVFATFEGLQKKKGANFEVHFDGMTGATQLALPVNQWDKLGIAQEKAGYLVVGLEFRPVVGGARGMPPSRNNHGDIFFLGIPLATLEQYH